MDNASAALAIALQLKDLQDLESSGAIDKVLADFQRQQLQIDAGFNNVTFETSRRLAISMANAVKDDGPMIARTTTLPPIDDATYSRLACLNQLPPVSALQTSAPLNLPITPNATQTSSSSFEVSSALAASGSSHRCRNSRTGQASEDGSSKNTDASLGVEIIHQALPVRQNHKFPDAHSELHDEDKKAAQDVSPHPITNGHSEQPVIGHGKVISNEDCASCGEHLPLVDLVKASCEHFYCQPCFEKFIEASLETHDGFPPSCCKTPMAFRTVADNISAPLFWRYYNRQEEIQNATAL